MNTQKVTVGGLFTKRDLQHRSVQYQNFEAEIDETSVITGIQFAEQLFPQKVFMLCPVSHPAIRYVSNSFQGVFGYSATEIKSKTVAEFAELIHPEDMEGFMRCLNFVESQEPLDPTQHRIVIHYRLKKKAGDYVQICDEKIGLPTQSGRYIYMAVLHDASKEQKTNNVKVEILKRQKGGFLKVSAYNPQLQQSEITPRQEDIIRLIKKGFTNKEIADFLHVSIYTVKNHKQALFKKIKINSSLELASMEISVP